MNLFCKILTNTLSVVSGLKTPHGHTRIPFQCPTLITTSIFLLLFFFATFGGFQRLLLAINSEFNLDRAFGTIWGAGIELRLVMCKVDSMGLPWAPKLLNPNVPVECHVTIMGVT